VTSLQEDNLEFRINDIPFLNFNFQFEKELHNKEGKPNQKCGCYWECGKVYDFEVLEDFKEIFFPIDSSKGKADNLEYKDRIFKGKLPVELDKFGKELKYQEKAKVELDITFKIDNKKLFEYLYKNKNIKIIFKDTISDIAADLNNIPDGDIEIEFVVLDSEFPSLKPLLTNYQPNETAFSFKKKIDSSILDLKLSSKIKKIETDNLYIISKKENKWKYKIDVQNYFWITGNCDYEETDDLDIEFEFTSNNKNIEKIDWEILTGEKEFRIFKTKKFIYNIIKNNSYEDKFEPNPEKHCPEPKEVDGKAFALDEELPVNKVKYDIVIGRKK
jgi:hypothetical protein